MCFNWCLVLDTDIGPDVDDVGALALLHILRRKHPHKLLAVTHCTSSPYGCGCIDVINCTYGMPDVPIGTYEKPGFLDGESYYRYNRAIAQSYPNRFQSTPCTTSALEVLLEALRASERKATTLVAIGPLNNIANLLSNEEGRQLVKEKCTDCIFMAGGTEQVEWNIEMDIPSAQAVFRTLEQLDIPVLLTPFETGAPIITGKSWNGLSEEHPLRKAYTLFSPDGRQSWDLTAIWVAVSGVYPFFQLSERFRVTVAADGRTVFTPHEEGNVCLLLNAMAPEEIAASMDGIWE